MTDKIRIGLLGAGGIARSRHLPVCASLDEVEIAAVFDVNQSTARSAAVDFDIPDVYADYRQLLKRTDIDAVIITTPNVYHAPIAMDAMSAGKHVLCEKPMASTLQMAQEMVRVQQETNRVLMIALNNRFRPQTQWMRELIDNNELGTVYHVKTGWMRRAGIPGWGGWFTTKETSGGGPLIDLGVHMLDLALWLMGNPEPIAVSGVTYSTFGDQAGKEVRTWNVVNPNGLFDVEDLASAFIRFANGSTLTLDVSWAANIEKERRFLQLFGTKGGIQMENDEVKFFGEKAGQLIDVAPQFFSHKPASRQPSLLHREGGTEMIREFVRAIRTGSEPVASGKEGMRVVRILDALYRSAQEGSEIHLEGERVDDPGHSVERKRT